MSAVGLNGPAQIASLKPKLREFPHPQLDAGSRREQEWRSGWRNDAAIAGFARKRHHTIDLGPVSPPRNDYQLQGESCAIAV